jgi:hypothetical protein
MTVPELEELVVEEEEDDELVPVPPAPPLPVGSPPLPPVVTGSSSPQAAIVIGIIKNTSAETRLLVLITSKLL